MPALRDPADQLVLAILKAAQARYLITGDKDLLALRAVSYCFAGRLLGTPRQLIASLKTICPAFFPKIPRGTRYWITPREQGKSISFKL
ncbi:hypothetical protein SAMN05216412_106106 [Nitrosospira multiformis]|uniref:PIN domain-containing protein n=1 Tax=Nitrosospira multiformis TaxID=1231 RepID=A0A1I0EBK5_9PROT|nr:hypothetical protein [Nitrosospira multiformis]SET42569.1 hypothetical protein SAMN05216412_106106 [Nitrosospira multiformis]